MFNFVTFSKSKKINPILIKSNEYAWQIKHVNLVMNYLFENDMIILGGDILNKDLNYTYDNWFYEPCKNNLEDLKKSHEVSINFIKNYTKIHGENFLVVFVVKKASI